MLARFISASHAALLYARFLGWRTLLPEKTPELDRYEGIGNHRDETGGKARQTYSSELSLGFG
jgi:hypothetical protein